MMIDNLANGVREQSATQPKMYDLDHHRTTNYDLCSLAVSSYDKQNVVLNAEVDNTKCLTLHSGECKSDKRNACKQRHEILISYICRKWTITAMNLCSFICDSWCNDIRQNTDISHVQFCTTHYRCHYRRGVTTSAYIKLCASFRSTETL